MHIYLMRHGIADSGYSADEPALTGTGRMKLEYTANYIKNNKITFNIIISSPKLRAAQTADIIAKAVNYPIFDIIRSNSLQPNATPADALHTLAGYSSARSILCVGHLPSLPRLAATLVGLSSITSFSNATLYRLDTELLQPGHADFIQLFSPE